MTTLATRSYSTGTELFAAAVQARTDDLVDFQPGSILGAVGSAETANGLWLQALILQVLAVARLATSFGTDVDSFVGQFGVARIGASAATGLATFRRFTVSTTAPLIPVGAQVKTTDGSQIFAVYADPLNSAYSAALGGYVMASSVGQVIVPVQAVNLGTVGNVAAGAISLPASSIPGVDAVTNVAAFTNGVDAEQDPALKSRFLLFIQQLSKATRGAIAFAIVSLQAGLQVTIQENVSFAGVPTPGLVSVAVDDGSGVPPSALLASAAAAADAVRAAGIRVSVNGPVVAYTSAIMSIATLPGYYHPDVVAAVAAKIATNINALGLGAGLAFFDLAAWARAVPGVASVQAGTVGLNGGTADIAGQAGVTLKAGSIVVS